MYGKVFASMYDGTLATKGPWQALVTFQQMIVLADKDGVVDMTAGAISRRTSIPIEIIVSGLVELMAPDPESRSEAEDGRRIVLLEPHRTWGWQIVNYAKYAALRSAEERREYMRVAQAEHRAKKAAASKNVMTNSDNTPIVKMSTDVPVPVPVKDISHPSGAHPPAGGKAARFVEFWTAWPAGERKQDKAKCLKHWRLHGLDAAADAVLADVRAKRGTHKWAEGFIEAPLVYLRGKRWEDGGSEGPAAVLEVIDNRRAETERLLSEQKAHPATKPPQAVRDLLKSKGVAA